MEYTPLGKISVVAGPICKIVSVNSNVAIQVALVCLTPIYATFNSACSISAFRSLRFIACATIPF